MIPRWISKTRNSTTARSWGSTPASCPSSRSSSVRRCMPGRRRELPQLLHFDPPASRRCDGSAASASPALPSRKRGFLRAGPRLHRTQGIDFQEFEIQLVHQRRGLQGVVRCLAPHHAGRQALQFGIESFDQLFRGLGDLASLVVPDSNGAAKHGAGHPVNVLLGKMKSAVIIRFKSGRTGCHVG